MFESFAFDGGFCFQGSVFVIGNWCRLQPSFLAGGGTKTYVVDEFFSCVKVFKTVYAYGTGNM